MSEQLSLSILSGSLGIFGVVLGIIITKLIEQYDYKKREFTETRKAFISNIDSIQENIYKINLIVSKVLNFVAIDFDNKEKELDNMKMVAELATLNLDAIKTAWPKVRKDIYLYFPVTISDNQFQKFEYFMNTIYETLEYPISEDGLKDNDINKFQSLITEQYGKNIAYSFYIMMILINEMKNIINGKNKIYTSTIRQYKRKVDKHFKIH